LALLAEESPMSDATKLVLATLGISIVLAVVLIANLALL
jgi:hypothetical protein